MEDVLKVAHQQSALEKKSEKNNPKQKKISAAIVYEKNAPLIFSLLRWFLSQTDAIENLQNIAQKLLSVIPSSGYSRYVHLVCLRVTYQTILKNSKAKVPNTILQSHHWSAPQAPLGHALDALSQSHHDPLLHTRLEDLSSINSSVLNFSKEELLLLLLRDHFSFTCKEIASIAERPEGSIRTRLELARAKLFQNRTHSEHRIHYNLSHSRPVNAPVFPNQEHICIYTREALEDVDLDNSEKTPIIPPEHLQDVNMKNYEEIQKQIGTCKECKQVLERRISSIMEFRNNIGYVLPEKLKTFPITPLLVKEGRRWALNWAAAPWYIKVLFEGALATSLVLGIVFAIPQIKRLYEFWQERRLDLYSIAELTSGLNETAEEHPENNSPVQNLTPVVNTNIKPETEFAGKGSDKPSSDKVYRILIKTDAPDTLKTSILTALSDVQFQPADEQVPPGTELPGGIMFDIFIPLEKYKELNQELLKLGETKVIITRSKEKKIQGKARLKIWLQRI